MIWKLPPLPPIPKAVAPPPVTSAGVEVTGADELIGRLTMLPGMMTATTLQSMLDSAQEVMTDSKENYVPFLTGKLYESGVVFPSDDGAEVILSYGGPGSGAEDYALEQHENMSYNHPRGGGPKYLERPLAAHTQELIDNIGIALGIQLEASVSGATVGVDWREIRTMHSTSNVRVVRGYTRRSGRQIATYARRVRR